MFHTSTIHFCVLRYTYKILCPNITRQFSARSPSYCVEHGTPMNVKTVSVAKGTLKTRQPVGEYLAPAASNLPLTLWRGTVQTDRGTCMMDMTCLPMK